MIEKQMKILVEQYNNTDPYDNVAVESIWKKEIEVLSVSLDYTLEYLEKASMDEILVVSEVWEDIANVFKSELLIDAMVACQKRYPAIADDLAIDIQAARRAMSK